jgi:hypothetical protein
LREELALASDTNNLGNKNSGLGPTAVMLKLEKGNAPSIDVPTRLLCPKRRNGS